MRFKAVFLDFYGTLVHEDDEIIPIICEKIKANAQIECSTKEVGSYWWKEFSNIFIQSYGETFKLQREIGIHSLSRTIEYYKSSCKAEELIKIQFEHWIKPKIYDDTISFLEALNGTPIYILSNIDTTDILKATEYHHINVTDILTSEDVKSYKPRPELFKEALRRSNLNPCEVIHIGDSVLSDVGGAQNLGINAIWLNRLNKKIPDGLNVNHIYQDLNEVKVFLFN